MQYQLACQHAKQRNFKSPDPGVRQNTFDASARQTFLSALVTGPQIGDLETGAVLKVNFYSNPIIRDQYGILPLNVFGYLKNDHWRFAAGLQQDIFNPLNPTVLPFTVLTASGNTGLLRSQARIERFLHPSDESQITLTLGASEPLLCQSPLGRDAGIPPRLRSHLPPDVLHRAPGQ